MAKKRQKPEEPAAAPEVQSKKPPARKRATAKPAAAPVQQQPEQPPRPSRARTKSGGPKAPVRRAPAAPKKTTRAPAARKAAPRATVADALHVVMVASELHPFATSGGLSEVVRSLAQALGHLGHTVTVIVPYYRRVAAAAGNAGGTAARADVDSRAVLDFGGRRQEVAFLRRQLNHRVSAVFVDAPELFDRSGLYGSEDGDYPDNAYRFAVFSRAALEYVRLRGERPSLIHAHDWQAGLVPVYQKMLFSPDPVVGGVPVVFTIHNLAFQGNFPASILPDIGLPWEVFHVQAMEFWGQVSYLKAGINFSERITTVSPGYAREVLTPEMGFGFHGVLSRREDDFVGILNGIDMERWNPGSDPFIAAPYTADDLSGKAASKRLLLRRVGLTASDEAIARPLVGLVSRLTDQKGFDLVAAAIPELMELDAAWVMLGSGERRYEELWTELAARYPDRVSATIGYDEALEHLIEAGADVFLMPSHFEPCGLNQLNSLRYGTLPVVRATGGLDDTVEDAREGGGTGFKFVDYTPEALVATVRRAIDAFRNSASWRRLQQNAMRKDYSWDVSAREYVKVYRAAS
jgi:starch synthase